MLGLVPNAIVRGPRVCARYFWQLIHFFTSKRANVSTGGLLVMAFFWEYPVYQHSILRYLKYPLTMLSSCVFPAPKASIVGILGHIIR